MDIIEELQGYKRNLGLSNEMIAKGADVPIATVQKIFSGATKSPRRKTLIALKKYLLSLSLDDSGVSTSGTTGYEPGEQTSTIRYGHDEQASTASTVGETINAYGLDDGDVAGDEIENIGWIVKGRDDSGMPRLIFTRQGTYTVADLDALPDGVRAELIDGVLYQFGAPTSSHQAVILEVAKQLDSCAIEHGCKVFIAPLDVQLDCDDRTMLEPDIIALCDRGKVVKRGIYGAPDFVVEILSPSTRRRDLTIKTAKYERAGVEEYWIIDPEEEAIFAYRFDDNNIIYHYTFDDTVPVAISGGECTVDFSKVREALAWIHA